MQALVGKCVEYSQLFVAKGKLYVYSKLMASKNKIVSGSFNDMGVDDEHQEFLSFENDREWY